MEPISCTASLLTLISTAGIVGKGLQRILALRHAPDILLDLNDEIAGIYLVLQAVDCLIRQHAGRVQNEAMNNLCRVLEKSVMTLSKLENLICDKLTTYNRHGEASLDRKLWLLAESKVRDLKQQIRADRLELSNALSVLASSVVQSIPATIAS